MCVSLWVALWSAACAAAAPAAPAQPTPAKPATVPPTIRPFTTPGPGYTPAAARVASNAVDVADSYFYPEVLTVTVGTTVRWTHRGNTGHDVTSLDGRWGIALLPLGSDYEHTFTQPGVYDYFCYLHRPEMVGRVVVVR